MATSNRDAQTFLIKLREKYPQYRKYDNATLFSAVQRKYPQYRDVQMGTLPNANVLLDRLVKPFFSTSDIFPVAHQFAEGVFSNAPQNIVENPVTTSLSGIPGVQAKSGAQTIGSIASFIKPFIKNNINQLPSENTVIQDNPKLTPQSMGGKIAGIGANVLGGSIIPGLAGGLAIKRATDIDRAIGIRSDAVRNAASGIEQRIGKISRAANEEMGFNLSQVGQTSITKESFNEALRRTAQVVDPTGTTHTQPGSIANRVLSYVEEVPQQMPETDLLGLPRQVSSPVRQPMSGQQVQAELVRLKNELGFHPVAQAEFNTQFSELLPEELSNIKSARKQVFDITNAGKPLTKQGILNKAAKGTMGQQELSELQNAERGLGTNYLEKVIKAGKGVKNVKNVRNIIKGLGITGVGYGIFDLLKRAFAPKS